MVLLHTPWDAFSLVSESLVSFRGFWRMTQDSLATETMGFPFLKQAWVPTPNSAQPGTWGAYFHPALAHKFPHLPPGCPFSSGFKHPPIFILLLSPFWPLERIWTSFSDAVPTVFTPRHPPSHQIPHFLLSTSGISMSSSKASLNLIFLQQPRPLAYHGNR